jgi:hypothetical protein
VGPNAERALGGERGVLLGSRRAAWVDVLEFDPRPDVGIRRLVDLRFSAAGSWDVVGLSLSSSDLRRRLVPLLRELVPGDVVLTEKGPRFHSGAAWVEATLQRDFRRAT